LEAIMTDDKKWRKEVGLADAILENLNKADCEGNMSALVAYNFAEIIKRMNAELDDKDDEIERLSTRLADKRVEAALEDEDV
jgi:hypothetical protein